MEISLLHYDNLVFPASNANLFCVFQAGLPFRFRCGILEVVVVIYKSFMSHVIGQLAVWQRGCRKAGIRASLVKRQRVEGGKHSDIWKDWRIIFAVAVTVWRYIYDKRNVEVWTSVDNGFGVFCHTAVQNFDSIIVVESDCVEVTCAKAASASDAVL